VVAALREAGLECSDPKKGLVNVGFSCVETPNATGVNGRGTYVNELAGLEVYALDGDRETLECLTRTVLSVPYQGSDPEAAMAWIVDLLDAGTCTPGADGQLPADCTKSFGSASIGVSVETDGSLQIGFVGSGQA
jgi:hypothetical protein